MVSGPAGEAVLQARSGVGRDIRRVGAGQRLDPDDVAGHHQADQLRSRDASA
jgi:hypothetical protein